MDPTGISYSLFAIKEHRSGGLFLGEIPAYDSMGVTASISHVHLSSHKVNRRLLLLHKISVCPLSRILEGAKK